MASQEEFKDHLVKMIKKLPSKHRQMEFIEEVIMSLSQAVEELGLGEIVMNRSKMPKPGEEDNEPRVRVEKLEGEKLEAFLEMLKEDGVDLPKEIEERMREDIERFEGSGFGRMEPDENVKEIGDGVVVVSKHAANYMHDYETKTQLSKNFEAPLQTFMDTPAIVVEKDLDFRFNCGHCDDEHKSDLVIYFPSLNKKYHILSRLVRLL